MNAAALRLLRRIRHDSMETRRAGSTPALRSLLVVAGSVMLAGCGICTRNDGLSPKQWQDRERSVAAEQLPRARELLARLGDSTLVAMRPKSTEAEIGSDIVESFVLGGVFGLGGPYYAHSCIESFDSPSYFNLQRDYAWASADSLVLGTVSTSASASTDGRRREPPTRLGIRRAAAALADVTEAKFARDWTNAFLLFSYSAKGRQETNVLILPAGSDSAAKAFIAYVQTRAGLLPQRGR
jgi:hypothetical protein